MFSPYGRKWQVEKGTDEDFDVDEAKAAFASEPKISIWHNPEFYTPPATAGYVEWDPEATYPNWQRPITEPGFNSWDNEELPIDENDFFFVLEGADGEGRSELYPSLELGGDPTYLDWYCNLWVDYSALLDAGDDCTAETSTWAGDLPLWMWKDKGDYTTDGHYFRAIWKLRDYQTYLNTYNRVKNGEYEALYNKLIELYGPLAQEYNALVTELYAIATQINEKEAQQAALPGRISSWEGEILYYEDLIALAWDAHNQGNMADEGLLLAWRGAEADLLEVQQELRRIEENIALYDAGYGVYTWWGGFIADESAIYQARIDAILEDIANLQQQLIALENIRSGLIENYQ
jgi:hypothetical protein